MSKNAKSGPWTFTVCVAAPVETNGVYSNMTSSESFLFNSSRNITAVNLGGITSVRLLVNKQNVAGASGSKLKLKYSEEYSTSPLDYIDFGETPIELNIDVENTFLISEWIRIAAPQNDVYLAIIGSGGDGIISPEFGVISIEFA